MSVLVSPTSGTIPGTLYILIQQLNEFLNLDQVAIAKIVDRKSVV